MKKKFIHLHKAKDTKKGEELPASIPGLGVGGVARTEKTEARDQQSDAVENKGV